MWGVHSSCWVSVEWWTGLGERSAMKGKKCYFPVLRDDYSVIRVLSVSWVSDITTEAWHSSDT